MREIGTNTGEVWAVVGLGDGDEGKGKSVDALAGQSDIVIRAQGGSNAGHTLQLKDGREVDVHQIPAGVRRKNVMNIMGNGVLYDPSRLVNEQNELADVGIFVGEDNLWISHQAHVVLPVHRELDRAREKGKGAQGSTCAGIAFVAADKALREGVRAETLVGLSRRELLDVAMDRREVLAKRFKLSRGRTALGDAMVEAVEFAEGAAHFAPYTRDTVEPVNRLLNSGGLVLLEGAQAFGLDLDQGKYPYVTSTNTTVPGLLNGSGIPYQYLKRVIGVAKAVPTKVGGGVFVGQVETEEVASNIRGEKGGIDSEYGKTTGRPREIGYFDLPKLARAIMVNGVTELTLTKSDWVQRYGDIAKVVIAYELTRPDGSIEQTKMAPSSNTELLRCKPIFEEFKTWGDDVKSKRAKNYLKFIEKQLGVPVTMVGTGPGRKDLYVRRQGKQHR